MDKQPVDLAEEREFNCLSDFELDESQILKIVNAMDNLEVNSSIFSD